MSELINTTPTRDAGEGKQPVDRRDFLKKAGIVSAAGAVGAAAVYSGWNFQQKKPNHNMVTVRTPDNKLIEVPRDSIKTFKPILSELQKRGREGLKGKRWVMVIDLAKCRNARKCIQGCQTAHHLRPNQYHINTLTMQATENTPAYFMPKPCQHCDNPPCVSVCPVNATFKRQDGIVLIDNERCIGCRFCMAACPYSARIFNWEEPLQDNGYQEKIVAYEKALAAGDEATIDKLKYEVEYNVELNVPQKKGTVSKCLFSADRLREGKLPYCVSSCPNGVYWYGDQNEDSVTNGTTKETTRLTTLLEEKGAFQLMPELGTKPRVYYLPPKDRQFKFEDDRKPEGEA